ncbi:ferric-chelate reductase-like protein [Sphaerosporella brunnea]|uniref:ferric-chelate reductase (NADPH) n=1 Tax=Sphaerosporella brunnea TaxID=1250544 RepID=A0A5J5EWK1_9PEZI|nr:ferric-chelate reductase-like protein [Sphaerosporella brunnea]
MDELDPPSAGANPKTYRFHWGYGYETIPCVGGKPYCEYMVMYWQMHDRTMWYTFILWWVIGCLLIAVGVCRFWVRRKNAAGSVDVEGARRAGGGGARMLRTTIAFLRRRLLPHGNVFGMLRGVSRVQITVLGLVCVYLTIFTFVGGTYNKVWQDGTKKRTALGWWSDRIGSIAYALTPLTVVLSARDNLFSLITGIPYQHFNFMHRALGQIIFAQSLIHTIAWTIVQGHFYNPATQPAYLKGQWQERYYQWGFIAMMMIAFLWVGSLSSVVRWMGYEAFRKSHYILALLFCGACWAHWPQTFHWLVASIAVILFDRGLRLLRMALLHYGLKKEGRGVGFKPAEAVPQVFSDDDGVVVVTLRVKTTPFGYKPGQHFFLTFPSITLWQSHPFTPAVVRAEEQVYVIVAMSGETARLAAAVQTQPEKTLPVVLCGAYGCPVIDPGAENYLLVAGGTGVSFTLPLVAALITTATSTTNLRFVWIVRRERNVAWIHQELVQLVEAAKHRNVRFELVLYVTRDTVKGKEIEKAAVDDDDDDDAVVWKHAVFARPACADVVAEWVHSTAGTGRSQVLASGPQGMGRDLRSAVAAANDAARVWSGEEAADVGLYWDARYQ